MLNCVFLAGRLGEHPELRSTPSGQKVCSLRVATNKKWTDKQGQKQEVTSWHSVNVWGSQAESCAQYLSKGRQVLIEGEIEYKHNEKDGVKRTFTTIKANKVQFLGDKQKPNNPHYQPDPVNDTGYPDLPEYDEAGIPF